MIQLYELGCLAKYLEQISVIKAFIKRPTNKETNNIKNNKVYYSNPLWVKIGFSFKKSTVDVPKLNSILMHFSVEQNFQPKNNILCNIILLSCSTNDDPE